MSTRSKSREKSKRVLALIIRILEEENTPLSVKEIAYRVESQSNRRCSVWSIGNILAPMVKTGELIRRDILPVSGLVRRSCTYELNT